MFHINSHTTVLLTLAAMLAASSAFAESVSGDPVAGKIKSQSCQGCHGMDGNSTDGLTPKLAGQYEAYISKQMLNYKDGIRTHAIMKSMAAMLSEQDLADISAYFARQTTMKGNGAKLNKIGKNIYLKGNIAERVTTCVLCHGEGGKGLTPDTGMYPVIGGQHKAYLLKQLIDFRKDDRTNSPNAIMNRTLKALSDAELDALAEYISVQ
jgi:cytochrome c553